MKRAFFLVFIVLSAKVFSQIGINVETPKATLDIQGTDLSDKPDGLLIPRFTIAEITAKDTTYNNDHNGTLIFITTGSGTLGTKTEYITGKGFYYYDSNNERWKPLSMVSGGSFEYGALKKGIQPGDHNGWVKLDGRSINSLSTIQKARAMSFGYVVNLPDAANLVMMQNGMILGDISGSNERYILQPQLPDFTLDGTALTAGSHTHVINGGSETLSNGLPAGTREFSPGTVNETSTEGDHSHTYSIAVNGGVTQQMINILPQNMSVNVFIFLGS